MVMRLRLMLRLIFFVSVTLLGTNALAGFIPAPDRVDMVYDTARDVLYITSGDSVLRYKMSTDSFLKPYKFGSGNLSGIDLSPDGNTLAIADRNITGIHLIDLTTNTIKPDIMFTPSSGEAGSFTLAYGSDGALLVTTQFNGSGWVPLRRLDPSTGAVTTIDNMINQDSMLSASADGNCIGFAESNSSSGPVNIYDIATQTVTKSANTTWFNYEIGANRDCTQFAVPTYGGTFIYNGSLTKLGTLGTYAGAQPISAAYHPTKDIVYFAWTQSKEVRAYDTNSYSQVGSFDTGHTFQNTGNYAFVEGRLKVARDGSYLFVTIADGVHFERISFDPVAHGQTLFMNGASPLNLALTGYSPKQLPLSYTIVTQPAHGTLQGTAPNLTYTVNPGYSGEDSFTFKVSDGTLESPAATVLITIDREKPAIGSFTLPDVSSSLMVAIAELTAGDNTGVSGYCLSETATSSGCSWSASAPTNYKFASSGAKTLYAFARDAAGNVSDPSVATTNIMQSGPVITTFTIPSTYPFDYLTIPVTLTASDSIGVTGYCLTETPDPAGCSWSGSTPTSYTFATIGTHTLYAFAKNGAGLISPSAGAVTSSATTAGLIPAPNRVDMAYDYARDILYITSGTSLLRYKLGTGSFLEPFQYGLGNLSGLDISPDGNTLAIADRNITGIHLIDLTTDTKKPDIMFTPSYYEGGSFTVAYGNDGALLVTTQFNGSGWVPLRRVDPGTGVVTTINTPINNEITQDSMLSASADGKCIGFVESNISNGPVNVYDVATQQITQTAETDWFNYEIGTSRDCSQFAVPTYGGTYIYNASLVKTAALGKYADSQPIGVAYHPATDILYTAWSETSEVRALSSKSFTLLASYNVGNPFQNGGAFREGRLKVSRDGSALFAIIDGGVYYQPIVTNAPVANFQTLEIEKDSTVSIILIGSSPKPKHPALSFAVVTPPSHGILRGTAPFLVYTPAAGFTGIDTFTFKTSDGDLDSNTATITIVVKAPPQYSLTTNISGNGSINNIRQDSPPFTCTSSHCTELFDKGTQFTLRATPTILSSFTGWSGNGCSGISDCSLTLNGNATITATFDTLPLVKIVGNPNKYVSFSGAYAAVSNGSSLRARNVSFIENLDLNRPVSVSITGGFESDFNTINGYTILSGKLSIGLGALIIDNLVIH